MEKILNFCPRCGGKDIDTEKHGSEGSGVCRDCGTIFTVLSVRIGQKTVPVIPGESPDERITRAKGKIKP